MSWTKEEEQKAKRMFLNGQSYAKIAEELGRSRSSVTGKLSRQKIVRKHFPRKKSSIPIIIPETKTTTPASAVPFAATTNNQCRFPIDLQSANAPDMLVCGQPVKDKRGVSYERSYCKYHCEVTERKRKTS